MPIPPAPLAALHDFGLGLAIILSVSALVLAPHYVRHHWRCPACRRFTLERMEDLVEVPVPLREIRYYHCDRCNWEGIRQSRRWIAAADWLRDHPPAPSLAIPRPRPHAGPPTLPYGRAPAIAAFLYVPHDDGGFTMYVPPERLTSVITMAATTFAIGALLTVSTIWVAIRLLRADNLAEMLGPDQGVIHVPPTLRAVLLVAFLAGAAATMFYITASVLLSRRTHTMLHLRDRTLTVMIPAVFGSETETIDLRPFCGADLVNVDGWSHIDLRRPDNSTKRLPLGPRPGPRTALVLAYLQDYFKTAQPGTFQSAADAVTSTPTPPPTSPGSSPSASHP